MYVYVQDIYYVIYNNVVIVVVVVVIVVVDNDFLQYNLTELNYTYMYIHTNTQLSTDKRN